MSPNLVTILVGDDPASRTYLRNKHSACAEVGINSRNVELKADTSQAELERRIAEFNSDTSVTGILLQIPLPKGLNDASAIAAISKEKDVDGLNPYNLGLLTQRDARIAPCTPRGVVLLLKYYDVKLVGQHAVDPLAS